MLKALLAALACLSSAAAWAEGPLGPEFQVNSYTTGAQAVQNNRTVAADGGGSFVVVWQSDGQDGSGYGIFGQRFSSSGVAVATEFQVNTVTQGDQRYPAVAAAAGGDFVVAWGGVDGNGGGIRAQRFGNDGAKLGGEFPANSYATYSQTKPSIAIDSSGDFVVVWQSAFQDDDFAGVFGRRFSSAGTALGTDFQVNTYTTGDQLEPRVAADANGNFVVVWWSDRYQVDEDGDGDGVFGQRFASNGSKLATQFRVNTYTTNDQSYPSVAADAAGNFVVAWESLKQDGATQNIYSQRFSANGSRAGSEFRVNSYVTGAQTKPNVSFASNGGFAVVWSGQGNGDGAGVFFRGFSSVSGPVGDFLVNAYTTDGQSAPAIAAGTDGSFLIVWQSKVQDGSGPGVFGRLLAVADLIFRDGFE